MLTNKLRKDILKGLQPGELVKYNGPNFFFNDVVGVKKSDVNTRKMKIYIRGFTIDVYYHNLTCEKIDDIYRVFDKLKGVVEDILF